MVKPAIYPYFIFYHANFQRAKTHGGKMERSDPKNTAYWIELFVSAVGVAVCLLITYFIWRSLAPNQDMWLLPGLYLIELAAGSAICFLAFYLQHPRATTISWIYSGILVVFIVLGSFTVGLLYVSVFLIFAGLSIYSTNRHHQNLLVKLGIFVFSILVQLGFVLFFVRILA